MDVPTFVFVSCQVGAEKALKQDLGKHHPQLVFAFSRPGFVTFKVDGSIALDQPLKSPFARAFGISLGSIKLPENSPEEPDLQAVLDLLPSQRFQHIHVWRRDHNVPGEKGFEPFHLPQSIEFGEKLRQFATQFEENTEGENSKDANDAANQRVLSKADVNRTAKNGDAVADIIVVDPNHWFVGWHKAFHLPSRWPGGVPPLRAKEDMVSRAYLKMQESLRWSQLPIAENDLALELGSSPGGSCLALLESGLQVIGVDPAIMDERILAHPNFKHYRARAADLKRKEFADVKWLFADANIAPGNTLDAIEAIVTNRRVHIQGMLITLKLLSWEMASEIDNYVERIKGWGYRHLRVRQLAFNRRELCVYAAKSKARMRFTRRSKSAKKPVR